MTFKLQWIAKSQNTKKKELGKTRGDLKRNELSVNRVSIHKILDFDNIKTYL